MQDLTYLMLDDKKSAQWTMIDSEPTISYRIYRKMAGCLLRTGKLSEHLSGGNLMRGRYTLLLGLGRYRKSIYVNPLGKSRRA